jgi:L-erythro-3,5-diaminohexanoate dehydrogenase
MTPCKYGTHRVIEPKGVLPQAAYQIDSTPMIYENEVLIDVDILNIDSASFHQIRNACNDDLTKMRQMMKDIITTQGKMQNPITKSGGMLIGTVREVGSMFHDQTLKKGMRIATLVSLSLTPLHLVDILDIDLNTDQVRIVGQAILFDSGLFSILPPDLDEKLVLSALDVAGAPAQVSKLAHKGDTVFVIGAAGKSGVLCCYQAHKMVKPTGIVIGLVYDQAQKRELDSLGYCDHILVGDATESIHVYEMVHRLTQGRLADLTINVVNVQNTEMTTILTTKDHGIAYFFSMATSFTKAALGAEGVGKDITMMIGNGYTESHAAFTLDIFRESKALFDLFTRRYT